MNRFLKRYLLLLFSITISSPSWCQDGRVLPTGGIENAVGIVNGPNHAYFIQAPKGWVLDNGIWAEQKIFAVFYEAGKTIQESPIVAYTMVQEPSPEGIEDHIKADMVHSLKGSKTAVAKRQKDLKTQDGRKAIVYTLTGVPGQNPEWMAFVEAPTVVILVSVSVKDIKNFQKGKILLKNLVSSVGWFTENVIYNNKRSSR